MSHEALKRLRRICLALPEAVEAGGVGDPSFKVRDKIFAMQHAVDGRPSLWCKAPRGVQGALAEDRPEQFFVPPYVGRHGWIGMWLDVDLDWDEVADMVAESFAMTAPKRLVARLAERDGPAEPR